MASWLSGLFPPPLVCEHNTVYSVSNQQGFRPRFTVQTLCLLIAKIRHLLTHSWMQKVFTLALSKLPMCRYSLLSAIF